MKINAVLNLRVRLDLKKQKCEMLIMILEKMFSADRVPVAQEGQRQLEGETDVMKNSPEVRSVIPTKFKDDVERLTTYSGTKLKRGMTMELTLQELLEVCPRERKRSDAYGKLIDYLASELGVVLTIKKK